METDIESDEPTALPLMRRRAEALGFKMSCVPEVGRLLRTLAAAKPAGRFLELGTGIGASAAWMLGGMDKDAHLTSVDSDAAAQDIAREILGDDERLRFVCGDGDDFINRDVRGSYDLIFADAFPGKFAWLDEALDLLAPGGIYVVDDLLPQDTWPENHQPSVDAFRAAITARDDLTITDFGDWSTGVLVAVKKG